MHKITDGSKLYKNTIEPLAFSFHDPEVIKKNFWTNLTWGKSKDPSSYHRKYPNGDGYKGIVVGLRDCRKFLINVL